MTPPAAYVAAARASAERWRRPASVALGQAQIESHFGRNMPPSSNNPLGIKEYRNGKGSIAITGENAPNGRSYREPLAFRVFASIEEAFDFHGRLLATDERYAPALAVLPDLRRYVGLVAGVYATGRGYADLLWRVITGSRLRQYDL
jgi:flagellum-specific peptidoglycan hydrolase FlgJ